MGKRKLTKPIAALVMSLILLLSPTMALAGSKDASTKLDYLALGDSLAAGQTPNRQIDKGYGDYIAGQLAKMDLLASFDKRFAVPGYTTSDVLMDIETNIEKKNAHGQSIKLHDAIKNAEVITLDIGANDLLSKINIDPTKNEVSFDQQQIQTALMEVGQNLAQILTTIKTLNPNVDIYVMGYYNPFPYLPENVQTQLTQLLGLLNQTIENTGKPFQVVFVPTAEVIGKNPTIFLPNPNDIHPNKAGYLQLANAIWNKMNVKKSTVFQDELPNWAIDDIQFLVQKGIINGYSNGNFGSADKITRLQSALMIDRSIIFNHESVPKPSYLDVFETSYGFDVIARVTAEGVFSGNNGYFYPDQSLTRAQMAKVLVQAFDLTGAVSQRYHDVPSDHWAGQYISILTENGIIDGYPNGTFKPDQSITRAEFSKMLARSLKKSHHSNVAES